MKTYILLICLFATHWGIQAQNQTKTMKETKEITSRNGAPLTLLGQTTKTGDKAVEFKAVDVNGQDVSLSDFKGKIVVITVFPSIDTPVCARQTREFNHQATSLDSNIVVLTLSKDLPFALGRFCAAEGIKNIHTLSDYKYGEFGANYGFLIKEMNLLSRGTVILDKDGTVVYAEYVPDIVREPNYVAAIEQLDKLTGSKEYRLKPLAYSHDALEPVISKETIEYHYGKHLQTYINNLNKLLEGSVLVNEPIEEIVRRSDGALFNNAAQVFNHEFYFNTFDPTPKTEPEGKLKEAIVKKWGSVENFKKEFSAAAVSIFGSGWAWLAADKDGELSILKCSNAENPLTKSLIPLLTADVWEHAYYIDYRNRRADHVEALWKVIDWSKVEQRYGN